LFRESCGQRYSNHGGWPGFRLPILIRDANRLERIGLFFSDLLSRMIQPCLFQLLHALVAIDGLHRLVPAVVFALSDERQKLCPASTSDEKIRER
jgi:hypothetical protein